MTEHEQRIQATVAFMRRNGMTGTDEELTKKAGKSFDMWSAFLRQRAVESALKDLLAAKANYDKVIQRCLGSCP